MLGSLHPWIAALHVVSVIAWMAGMLYLPRLFVYHAGVTPGSAQSELFKIMERRLLRLIATPAMLASFLFGGLLLADTPDVFDGGWIHVKLAAVLGLSAMHGLFARWTRDFENDRNARPARFYRWANEAPTVLMIVIVIMAIVKPF